MGAKLERYDTTGTLTGRSPGVAARSRWRLTHNSATHIMPLKGGF
jgi:hypothetical protein